MKSRNRGLLDLQSSERIGILAILPVVDSRPEILANLKSDSFNMRGWIGKGGEGTGAGKEEDIAGVVSPSLGKVGILPGPVVG